MFCARVQGLTLPIARRTHTKLYSYLTKMSTYSTNCVVGYATDVEGNLKYWNNYVSTSKVLERRDGRLYLKENCQFVYGGDVCDRGRGDIRVLTDLVNLKLTYPERVHLIMGNRDINKLRLPSAMHPFALAQKPRCYWLRKPNPKILEGYRLNNRVDKLKWTLLHTMGSPLAFEYRRQELQDLGLPSDDESVVDSYLKLIQPEGLLTQYLELAKICVIIGDIVFVHGAFLEHNLGWVPSAAIANEQGIYQISADREIEEGRKCGGFYLENLREWAQCINNFALNEIREYMASFNSTMNELDHLYQSLSTPTTPTLTVLPLADSPSDTEPEVEDTFYIWDHHGGYSHSHAGTRLLTYGMGWLKDRSVNPSVIYATYLEGGKPQPLSDKVRAWLTRGGVSKVVVGHQPNGDAPFTMSYGLTDEKEKGTFLVLSGDTSYSRNVQYRLQDLQSDSSSAYYEVIDKSAGEDKWMSVDQYRTTVNGREPADEAIETRCPNTMSELLFFFPSKTSITQSSDKGCDSGSVSYTGIVTSTSLDDWTHSSKKSVPPVNGVVSAFVGSSCDVLVHGRNSLEARYAFKLTDTVTDENKLSCYVGRETKDGWYVKAFGVILPKDPEAEVLSSADLDQLKLVTDYEVSRSANPSRFFQLSFCEGHIFKSRLVAEHLIDKEF